ncbi:MAG: 16S rRNA (uracil(1498)-N(3))-methyltransferase, partial [Ktedonobacteraceae bacterium]|nr:16S rRNA (uracil(1498)-N(3))-methyltransferase [Ktedonobacteraceae bacterium]
RLAHQVRSVLRLAAGEQLILLDNSGDELLCTVVRSERTGVEVEVLERRSGLYESPVRIVLCQGLLKSARFEWILEKGTELGVSTFVPVLCRRSTAGLEETGSSKIQRWQRILQEATEQCGRARIPELLPTRQLMQAFHDIPDRALAFIPWEEERELGLRAALQEALHGLSKHETAQQLTVVLFIGPEGGFLAEEVELARKYGVRAVTLGPRIMRAETAAIAAVANVMYELER